MIRLFIPHDLKAGAELALDEGQSRYLSAVMRQAVGDEIGVFNGRDGEWRARISAVGKRVVAIRAAERTRVQPVEAGPLLVVALVKRARLEVIVEKATELGAGGIDLMITDRTNADHARVDRLRAIATEAAEQTGRLDVPAIAEPMKLERMIGLGLQRAIMFCDEAGDAQPALAALERRPRGDPWAILIGPEGGFSPAERLRLRALPGAVPVSLGPRILRADTAAISALTLWQAALGDWAP